MSRYGPGGDGASSARCTRLAAGSISDRDGVGWRRPPGDALVCTVFPCAVVVNPAPEAARVPRAGDGAGAAEIDPGCAAMFTLYLVV